MTGACVHCGEPTSMRVKFGTTRDGASLLRRLFDALRSEVTPAHWCCVPHLADELRAFMAEQEAHDG